MILVMLQNAHSRRHAGRTWPRERWLEALGRSRSGTRLRVLLPEGREHYLANTTPRVAATPDEALPPDGRHIHRVLRTCRPLVVVACGRQAEHAMRDRWAGPLLAVPHPASRTLSDALYREARALLEADFRGRVALRQLRGGILREDLMEIAS